MSRRFSMTSNPVRASESQDEAEPLLERICGRECKQYTLRDDRADHYGGTERVGDVDAARDDGGETQLILTLLCLELGRLATQPTTRGLHDRTPAPPPALRLRFKQPSRRRRVGGRRGKGLDHRTRRRPGLLVRVVPHGKARARREQAVSMEDPSG